MSGLSSDNICCDLVLVTEARKDNNTRSHIINSPQEQVNKV